MKDIYNYLYLNEKLSSGGMPTAEQLKEAANAGVRVVINLATPGSQGALPKENEVVASLGMKYINIPVDWDNPTQQNIEDFYNVMDENKNNSILVHCQANFRATGFVTLYRILRLGWKPEDAFVDMHKIWHEDEFPIWKKFIEDQLTSE